MIDSNYDRVTQVLGPFSGYQNVPKDILEKACIRGSKVHAAIDAYLNSLGMWIEEERGYIDSFMQWWNPKWEIIPNPGRLYCKDLMITGECDLLIRNEEGMICLIDFKTSSKEGSTWGPQGGAYYHLICKNTDIIPDYIMFVHLKKDGRSPKIYNYEIEVSLDEFLALHKIYLKYFKNKNNMDVDL